MNTVCEVPEKPPPRPLRLFHAQPPSTLHLNLPDVSRYKYIEKHPEVGFFLQDGHSHAHGSALPAGMHHAFLFLGGWPISDPAFEGPLRDRLSAFPNSSDHVLSSGLH